MVVRVDYGNHGYLNPVPFQVLAYHPSKRKERVMSLGQDIKEFVQNEKDVEFEEEISRNPHRLKSWWRYLLAKEGARQRTRNVIHERALKFLPSRWDVGGCCFSLQTVSMYVLRPCYCASSI